MIRKEQLDEDPGSSMFQVEGIACTKTLNQWFSSRGNFTLQVCQSKCVETLWLSQLRNQGTGGRKGSAIIPTERLGCWYRTAPTAEDYLALNVTTVKSE